MENIFQKICERLTKHKHRKLWAWCDSVEPHEYYYKCKLCRYSFWNTKKPTENQQSKSYKEANKF